MVKETINPNLENQKEIESVQAAIASYKTKHKQLLKFKEKQDQRKN